MMADKPFISVTGIDKAGAKLLTIQEAIGAYKGAEYARPHQSISSEELILNLKKQDRDLVTLSVEEKKDLSNRYKMIIMQRLEKLRSVKEAQLVGRIASADAWRKGAGKRMLEIMSNRAEKMLTKNNRAAKEVSDLYARMRKKKYGIPEDVVYKASGELINNLNPTNNNVSAIRLIK